MRFPQWPNEFSHTVHKMAEQHKEQVLLIPCIKKKKEISSIFDFDYRARWCEKQRGRLALRSASGQALGFARRMWKSGSTMKSDGVVVAGGSVLFANVQKTFALYNLHRPVFYMTQAWGLKTSAPESLWWRLWSEIPDLIIGDGKLTQSRQQSSWISMRKPSVWSRSNTCCMLWWLWNKVCTP